LINLITVPLNLTLDAIKFSEQNPIEKGVIISYTFNVNELTLYTY